MKKIINIILVLCSAAALFSCKEEELPVAKQTDLVMEVATVTATSAKVNISYTGDEPYYIRIMKAEPKDEMVINLEDKDALAGYVNTHSMLDKVPTSVVATGLETLVEYVCGAVAFNSKNEIIGANYITFTTQASEDAVGDEGGAGTVEIITL